MRLGEEPLIVDELLAGFEASEGQKRSSDSRGIALESLQLKRRRCDYKQARPRRWIRLHGYGRFWETIMKEVSAVTPRVGVRIEGDLVEKVQSLVHDMKISLIISCRGTEKDRLPTFWERK